MTSPAQQTLERRLGPLDGAAIIVSNVIGGTILFAPPFMAGLVPNPWLYLGLWVAGGALAFAGAMAYAELAALRPKAGGEYVYLDAAYGRVAAFLTGWTSFVAGFSGAIAANAFFIPIYLARFVPGVDNQTPIFTIPLPYVPLTFSTHTIVALASIWLLAIIHVVGVGPGRVTMNILAAAKVTAFMLFVLAGFAFGTGAFSNVTTTGSGVTTTNWLFAFIPVMLAYSGWNASAYVAEEIRDPGRNLPRSLAIGTFAVIAVYFGINLLYLFVFSITELAALKGSVLDVVADRLLGSGAGHVMGIVSIVSLMASNSAMTFAGPRVYFAMARDGVFLDAASKVHPSYKTPAFSIIAQTMWVSILILTGSGNALLAYTGFSITLFLGIAVFALFVLRRREPNAPRPFKALGYPIAPAIFCAACFIILANALYTDLVKTTMNGQPVGPSAWGFLVIGLGLPVYYFFARRR
ncbi:MAG TPA: amino acid permease [Vicinamibacterales bacterium]|jgi:APA family basic amino acid/polyamine antiporter|nr:amino acid permease [Vicinamibacterales bacterium]